MAGYKAAKDRYGHVLMPLAPHDKHHIKLVFYPPDKRRRDLDNLFSSMKHTLDGVASALGIDDSQFRPVMLDFGDVVKGGQVVMTIGE